MDTRNATRTKTLIITQVPIFFLLHSKQYYVLELFIIVNLLHFLLPLDFLQSANRRH